MNQIVTQQEKKSALVAGASIKGIVPQNIDDAWRIAGAISKTNMRPKGMETQESCFVAILAGLEVGLPPFQAIQSIAVINNRPAIWGDAVMALVRGSGKCEYVKEWFEGEGEKRTAFCEARRIGDEHPTLNKFSVDDAKKAGLWGKQGPWSQYPDRMLRNRARGFSLRDTFADVLRGIRIAEEEQDIAAHHGADHAIDVTPPEESSVLKNINAQIAESQTSEAVETVAPQEDISTIHAELVEVKLREDGANDWPDWAVRYQRMIEMAPDTAFLAELEELNKLPLTQYAIHNSTGAKDVKAATKKRFDELTAEDA